MLCRNNGGVRTVETKAGIIADKRRHKKSQRCSKRTLWDKNKQMFKCAFQTMRKQYSECDPRRYPGSCGGILGTKHPSEAAVPFLLEQNQIGMVLRLNHSARLHLLDLQQGTCRNASQALFGCLGFLPVPAVECRCL